MRQLALLRQPEPKNTSPQHDSSADSYIMSGIACLTVLSVGLAAVIEMVEHVIDRGG